MAAIFSYLYEQPGSLRRGLRINMNPRNGVVHDGSLRPEAVLPVDGYVLSFAAEEDRLRLELIGTLRSQALIRARIQHIRMERFIHHDFGMRNALSLFAILLFTCSASRLLYIASSAKHCVVVVTLETLFFSFLFYFFVVARRA